MSDSHFDEAPEMARVKREARRRELAAAGPSANQHIDKIRQSLKLPNLDSVETKVQPVTAAAVCPERFRVLGLRVGANQRIYKDIFEQWGDGVNCYQTTYSLGIQFTGYGAYCMSFEKDPTNSNLFANFFRDIAAYKVNFHRTMLFVNENYENPNTANLHRLLLDGDGRTTAPNPNYLANLDRMVAAAKSWGIVVQVCLFMHHSVANSAGATTPRPVALSGSAYDRYRAFYNTASEFQPVQRNFIDGVARQLLKHWNVVYEIGNELRVPGTGTGYGPANLKAWIDWAAARIRGTSAGHLITTSTGTDNEDVNALPRIQFCSFHQGQWKTNINGAVSRGNNFGGKHVVIDDDGGTRTLANVQAWSKAALDANAGCRASFNHKGFAPTNAYAAKWMQQEVPAGETKPIQALYALRDARDQSSSPCAQNN